MVEEDQDEWMSYATAGYGGAVDPILLENTSSDVLIHAFSLGTQPLEVDTTSLLLLDLHVRRLLVQPDPEIVQLPFNEELVSDGLARIEDDHDHVARSSCRYYLPSAPFARGRALDDSW